MEMASVLTSLQSLKEQSKLTLMWMGRPSKLPKAEFKYITNSVTSVFKEFPCIDSYIYVKPFKTIWKKRRNYTFQLLESVLASLHVSLAVKDESDSSCFSDLARRCVILSRKVPVSSCTSLTSEEADCDDASGWPAPDGSGWHTVISPPTSVTSTDQVLQYLSHFQ